MPDSPLDLSALALRGRLSSGELAAVELAQACLDRVAAEEPKVQAWEWIDPDHVLARARALDARRAEGRVLGPLHGLPVGLKDVIDTAGIPTGNGTPLDVGRVPEADAVLVAKLEAAGAIIMGKTVSTELAFLHPGRTRNPRDLGRTPGGSSSGSAAAVAAGMVPLAVGTQTGGSVIRPAAYCGIVGFKPTFGAIPRTGVLVQSPRLDTIGVFARSVEDAALLAEVLFGHDPGDRATRPAPPPRLLEIAGARPPAAPTLAFVRPPGWDVAEDETKSGFASLIAALGAHGFEASLPAAFDDVVAIRERINHAEMAWCFRSYERRGRDHLSAVMREALAIGKAVTAPDYLAALDHADTLNESLEPIFARCDAIVTPATPGPAPVGLASTGSSIFNGPWTLCGTPAVTVPLLATESGLPMGVQLVARRGDDARLLRTARWLTGFMASHGAEAGKHGG